MTRYDDVDYWDDRYQSEKEPFEWYQRYSGIRHFFATKYLKPSDESTIESTALSTQRSFPPAQECRVLIVGCGNSEVGQEMYCDGFKHISNVDFSAVVINWMRSRYTNDWYREMNNKMRSEMKIKMENGESSSTSKPAVQRIKLPHRSPPTKQLLSEKSVDHKMLFECMDITKTLEFDDESFDLIVCKGTLDAVLCRQNALVEVKTMMEECHRVLDNNVGVMVVVTYGGPDDRLQCFHSCHWREVKHYTVPKPMVPGIATEKNGAPSEHNVYILFKRAVVPSSEIS